MFINYLEYLESHFGYMMIPIIHAFMNTHVKYLLKFWGDCLPYLSIFYMFLFANEER